MIEAGLSNYTSKLQGCRYNASHQYTSYTYLFRSLFQCIQHDICMCIGSLYQCMFLRSYMDYCCTRLCLRHTITFQRNEINIPCNTHTPICHICDNVNTIGYLSADDNYFVFELIVLSHLNTLEPFMVT